MTSGARQPISHRAAAVRQSRRIARTALRHPRSVVRAPARAHRQLPVKLDAGSNTKVFTGYRVQHNLGAARSRPSATTRASTSTRCARWPCG